MAANPRVAQGQVAAERVDEGLRSYMLSVYNYMGLALALSGLVAYIVGTTPALYVPIFASPLKWLVMLAPLGFVMFLSFRIEKMSLSAAQITFWAFAAIMGLSLSTVFIAFTGASVARVFFITAAAFGSLSLYGYTTKRDLSGFGTFLFMGLVGIVIAMVVNIFLASSALQFAISVIGLLVFAGLTAYDTQQIKQMYYELDNSDVMGRKAIMGALRLYLDFINMFMFLMHFMGGSQD